MSEVANQSPVKAVMDIRRAELPLALLMFAYFFLVITTFWVLKPIKKALFIEFYDDRTFQLFGAALKAAQAELVAKVLNMGVAFAAVVVFSMLSRQLRRQQLTYVFSLFFIATLVVFAWALGDPRAPTVWLFYLYGDLYSTLMVATFFAFLNDSVLPSVARRIYGLVVLGGVLGGVLGTTVVRGGIESLSRPAWLWICLGLTGLVAAVARLAGAAVVRTGAEDEPTADEDEVEARRANPAVAGARLVFRSPYLLSIVTIVGVYEIVSTILDFQFTSTVAHYLDGDAIGRQFSTVYMITNLVSMFVQIFVTGFVMSRFHLTVALLVLPSAALLGSGAFMLVPGLWIGSLLNTADNGLSYSINQSAKEALYTPTTREEKYQAKAFIDMFVQRVAKALAVVASLGITVWFSDFSTVRWLSGLTIGLGAIWAGAARYAGKRFHELTDDSPAK